MVLKVLLHNDQYAMPYIINENTPVADTTIKEFLLIFFNKDKIEN